MADKFFDRIMDVEMDKISASNPDYVSGKKRKRVAKVNLVVQTIQARYAEASTKAQRVLEDPNASMTAKVNALATLKRSTMNLVTDEFYELGVIPTMEMVKARVAELEAEAKALGTNQQQPQQNP